MQIFEDQSLGLRPHIAVFSSSKVGNFVVTTPLLRGLKEKYPDCVLDFFGSEVTRDFEEACPYIDYRCDLQGAQPDFVETEVRRRIHQAGPYALAINCDEFADLNAAVLGSVRPRFVVGGPSAASYTPRMPEHRMLLDDDWNTPAFLERYSGILESNYIAEVLCRVAFVPSDYFRLEVASREPSFAVPDILVHATATRSAKMWPTEHWLDLLTWLEKRGHSAGLIGSAPAVQQAHYHSGSVEERLLASESVIDLRGKTPLLELAGALRKARALITVDAGPLHVAAAVDCPTVAVFGCDDQGVGASPSNLWAPRATEVRLTRSTETCGVCSERRYRNDGCVVDGHPCMTSVSVEQVCGLLEELL